MCRVLPGAVRGGGSRLGGTAELGSETSRANLRSLRAFSVDQRVRTKSRSLPRRSLLKPQLQPMVVRDRRITFCDAIRILPSFMRTQTTLTTSLTVRGEQPSPESVVLRRALAQDNAKRKEIKKTNEDLKEKILIQCEEVKRALVNKEKVLTPNAVSNRRIDLLLALAKMKKLGLTPRDFAEDDVFSQEPYQKPHSQAFFIAVKVGDLDAVKRYLKHNKFLVYDYDYVKQTALHWATRKGNLKVVEYLLKSGSDVDACDIMNRTSLYFAAKKSHVEIVKVLISYQPDPFVVTKNRRTPSEVATNSFIKLYLKNAKLVSFPQTTSRHRSRFFLNGLNRSFGQRCGRTGEDTSSTTRLASLPRRSRPCSN